VLIDVSAHIMTNARVTNFNTRMAFAPAACKVACMQSGSFETHKHLGCSIFVITSVDLKRDQWLCGTYRDFLQQ
jgi:hypothetical protein